MPEETPKQPADIPPARDRRASPRLRARGVGKVLRDNDMMRVGIEGPLRNVSADGLALDLPVALNVGEHVKIRVHNDIQRFTKEVRGIVRHTTAIGEAYHTGVDLFTRLTPREVMMLKTTLPADDAGNPRWM